MDSPTVDWLQEALDGRMEITGVNIWKAHRYRAYIQILDQDGAVFEVVPTHHKKEGFGYYLRETFKKVTEFRVTERGKRLIREASNPNRKTLKGADTGETRLWISALKRWVRNAPEGLKITISDGELHVLAHDQEGKIKDDEDHRVASVKVPWHK